jgi:hypothetical protein
MGKEKRAGRPKLPKGAAKSNMVRARVSPEELKKMETAAKRAGLKFSHWTRKTLLDAS